MKLTPLILFLIGLILLTLSCASPEGDSSSTTIDSAQPGSNESEINFTLTLNGILTGSIDHDETSRSILVNNDEDSQLDRKSVV